MNRKNDGIEDMMKDIREDNRYARKDRKRISV